MKEENIRKIGMEKGVNDLDLFVAFLNERFPNELDQIKYYFEEWAERFNNGSPQNHMDIISLRIYNKHKGE